MTEIILFAIIYIGAIAISLAGSERLPDDDENF
jgi:hypothetical protein